MVYSDGNLIHIAKRTFASFGVNFENLSRNAPQVIRICGQIYHNIYALHPNKNEA